MSGRGGARGKAMGQREEPYASSAPCFAPRSPSPWRGSLSESAVCCRWPPARPGTCLSRWPPPNWIAGARIGPGANPKAAAERTRPPLMAGVGSINAALIPPIPSCLHGSPMQLPRHRRRQVRTHSLPPQQPWRVSPLAAWGLPLLLSQLPPAATSGGSSYVLLKAPHCICSKPHCTVSAIHAGRKVWHPPSSPGSSRTRSLVAAIRGLSLQFLASLVPFPRFTITKRGQGRPQCAPCSRSAART